MMVFTGKFYLVDAVTADGKDVETLAVGYDLDEVIKFVRELAGRPEASAFLAFRVTNHGEILLEQKSKPSDLHIN